MNMSPYITTNVSSSPYISWTNLIGPASPRGLIYSAYSILIPMESPDPYFCLIRSARYLTESTTSSILEFLTISRIQSSRGLSRIGRSDLGLVRVSGLSLVANPPVSITALKDLPHIVMYVSLPVGNSDQKLASTEVYTLLSITRLFTKLDFVKFS